MRKRLLSSLFLLPLALSAPASAQDDEAPPVELAPWPEDGLRAGVTLAGASPTGETGELFGFGYGASGRLGYEMLWGTFGLTPQLTMGLTRFGGKNGGDPENAFQLMPGVRAQMHLGMLAPWASFGAGMASFGDSGGGFSLGLGVDLMERTDKRLGAFFSYDVAAVEQSIGDVHADSSKWLTFGLAGTFFL